jgi:hypothetical protein
MVGQVLATGLLFTIAGGITLGVGRQLYAALEWLLS